MSRIPLPSGLYKVVYADPAWQYSNWTEKKNGAAISHYSTMTHQEIAALPVGKLADPAGCALVLWATWPKMEEALFVMRSWGFQYKTGLFLWNKTYDDGSPYCGLGFYTRSGSEFCLLGLKGRMPPKSHSVRQVLTASRGRHSAKPHEIYERIETLWDGPYVELFARNTRAGWVSWGDEV